MELFLQLKYKLEIINEEVLNIAYAVKWANAYIINYFILSNEDIAK